jgi:hypothetical protein
MKTAYTIRESCQLGLRQFVLYRVDAEGWTPIGSFDTRAEAEAAKASLQVQDAP